MLISFSDDKLIQIDNNVFLDESISEIDNAQFIANNNGEYYCVKYRD